MTHAFLARIAQAVRGSAWEGRVYQVGGSVRDELLGRGEVQDLDLMVEQGATELARLLHRRGLAASPPELFPRFGTAMIRIDGHRIEIATARRESYEASSRKPEVEPASLLEDALRRDFTVNALMRDIASGELLDLTGQGLEDLRACVLRTPLDPVTTFRDDPLRMLRAVRFRRQLRFRFAPGLREAIESTAPRLAILSAERIRDELEKMLGLERGHRAIADLQRLGLLRQFWPEFEELVGCEQGSFHHLDVWGHTLEVLKHADPRDLALRLGALFHDVGKSRTKMLDEKGAIRFFGHERVGAAMSRDMLLRLRFPRRLAEEVARLVRHHMRFMGIGQFTPAAARRLLRDVGDSAPRLLDLVEADSKGLKTGVARLDVDAIRARLAEVSVATPRSTLESPLTGEEIMGALHLEPSAEVGRLKEALREAVVEGHIEPNDKPGAIRYLFALRKRQTD